MEYVASLREQATHFRELAVKHAKVSKPDDAAEYHDLAQTCEEVAAEIEERMTAG